MPGRMISFVMAALLLPFVALPGGAQTEEPELSARQMFDNPDQLFRVQKVSQQTETPQKTQTQQKAQTQTKKADPPPIKPPRNRDEKKPKVKESEQKNSGGGGTTPTGGDGGKVIRVAEVKTTLGLRYGIIHRTGEGAWMEVNPKAEFLSGDRIRLSIKSNQDAYLYIVQKGSSGRWSVLFPSAEIEGGNNHVQAGNDYLMPPGGMFAFDQQAGEEKVFIVLSRQPENDLESLIYQMRDQDPQTPAQAPAAAPAAPKKEQMLLAQNNIDDGVISRLRNQEEGEVYARELVFEKLPQDSAAKADKAMYIVNTSFSDDARVVADITLTHR